MSAVTNKDDFAHVKVSRLILRSYELVNMVFPTSQSANCVQLTSQLVNITCELEIF